MPGVVAVALALTAAFGGFDTAKKQPPERYAVGEVIDQSWFHTQVMRAYIGQASGQKPGIPALHVVLRVVNMTNVSSYQDPIITLGARKQTAFLRSDWEHSASMNVYVDGQRRGFLASQVKRPSNVDTYTLPPHIPVLMDTEWEMHTFGEKPSGIHVQLTGFTFNDRAFFDIPRYWTVIAEPEKPGTTGLQDEKPKMIADVPLPLSPSGFKPHPPVTKKPKPKPHHKPRHRRHRKPR